MSEVDKRARSERIIMRSHGQQSRSRERVEILLEAAEGLLTEVGLDGLKMRELARRAALPIASVYHYFPSSSAVARAVAIRHMENLEAFMMSRARELLQKPAPLDQRPKLLGGLVTDVAGFLLQSPATPAVWDSLRATPELRALDVKDTAKNAKLLEPLVHWAVPNLPDHEVAAMSMVMIEAVQSNLLLIMHSPKKSRQARLRVVEKFIVAAVRGMQLPNKE